ncbi:MAG TPA: ABC transporter ATP-binding protein [Thermomicrobiales bacterium]
MSQSRETTSAQPVLEVRNLQTVFPTRDGLIRAVDDVSFTVEQGKTLGIIGESGSGKSVTARSILRVVDRPGRVVGGSVKLFGRDLLTLSEREMREIRGRDIGMIFQDPGASLNPVRKVGTQIVETYMTHRKASKNEARERALESLAIAGIPNPTEVFDLYPVDLSSGAKQRVMIAMAIVCRPALLIADEPTTMLGVRTQRHILESLLKVQEELAMAMILITHDFGVVSWMADEIMVMYGGRVVEHAPKFEILRRPRHHYTAGLIRSVPLIEERREKRLKSIPGFPPDLLNLPTGCIFHPRCEAADGLCQSVRPELGVAPEDPRHRYACHHPVQEAVLDELKLTG